MNEMQILKKFIQLIEEFVDDPASLKTATRETNIIWDLKVNSARLVDIIIKAEDMFDIEINDDDADSIKTIGDAVDIVMRKVDITGVAA
ncbi:MAG: acyl carrier protein [Desulfobacterales bacterium]|nr:acyl carrier protein [Desulfobacterales bacterium]